jgi:signal transduction histidine kinase
MWRTATAGVAVAVLGLLLLLPLFPREPVFALVTVGVAAGAAALGVSLARDGERLCASALAFAGVLWLALAVDVHVPWGPIVSWTTTGLPAAALGCVLVHYRRRHPRTAVELALPVVGLGLTVGVRLAMVPFLEPTDLGFPPGAWWPAPWAGTLPVVSALEVSRASLCLLLTYVAVLGWRSLHPPGVRRGHQWPVLLAGTALAAFAAGVQLFAMVLAGSLDRHASATATGAVVLLFVAVVPLVRVVRYGLGAGSVHRLPRARTPETADSYVREITGDPTAELLYCSPDGGLLDATGHRRTVGQETRPGRFWAWVPGSHGERVALFTGRCELGGDDEALHEWLRAAALLAESVRPTVLLRTRLARLTALRVAEELARAEERERFRRDLHDGLHQTIAAARMDLDGLQDIALDGPGSTGAVIAGLEAKMAVALDQVRSLGGVAAPPAPDTELDSAIGGAASTLRLEPRVTVTGTRLGVLALPVFLLVREALTNVAKHAGAVVVDVRVHSDGRTVEIVVSDDGRGGAVMAVEGGIGGMRHRVEELGGTLVLDSPPDRGTTLRASIPCV